MFRAAGNRLLRDGKTRRRSFFSERELFISEIEFFFFEIGQLSDRAQRGQTVQIEKKENSIEEMESFLEEKKSLRGFPAKSTRFASSTDTFFLPLRLHDLNHKSIESCTLHLWMPLAWTSFMDTPTLLEHYRSCDHIHTYILIL